MTNPNPDSEEEMQQLLAMKPLLQMFGITPNDTQQQMFEKIFNPDQAAQMTVLPTKKDVVQLMCLGAVDQLTRSAFYTTDKDGKEVLLTGVPSLPKFLYDITILGMKSLKGTNLAVFKDIFLNNAPNEMRIAPVQLPSAIPESPKRSLADKVLGRNKE